MDKTITLLNSHLLLHFEMADPLERIEALIHERPAIKGALAERLLLYDTLIIPTTDFSILPVLVSWLGDGLLREMLDAGAIRFLRYRGSLGYAGNGNGLCLFRVEKGDRPSWEPWQEAPAADGQRAAEIWLARVFPGLTAKDREQLACSALAHSGERDALPDFDQKVAHETYMDALESPSLRTFFGIRSTNLTRLYGIGADQLKVFAPQRLRTYKNADETDFLLGMAAVNFELHLADLAQADDVAFDPSIEQYLIGKAERALRSFDLAQGFAEILSLNDLPDVPGAVASGHLTLADTWDIRNRRNALLFRRWFHEYVREEPRRAVNEYVAALDRPGLVDKLPAKILRFVVTNAASLLAPAAGIAASAFDSFLLKRIAGGYSPKYLIDDLRHAIVRRQ